MTAPVTKLPLNNSVSIVRKFQAKLKRDLERRKTELRILCSVDSESRYNSCKWPTWRTIFFSKFFLNSLHVSSNLVLIIKRINSINTTSGMCHSDSLVCRSGSHTHSDTYQMLYWFSRWWTRGFSKHVENWNKHREKIIVRQVGH
jgi:hypothetical protein